MKILVFGCNSMSGHLIALYFQERGHEVYGYDSTTQANLPIKVVTGSYYELDKITQLISKECFDAIVNTTAVVNQFADEDKANATFINAFLPHYLAKITKNTKTILVHRSTDCIFSGSRGNYGLQDTPDATSFYARSKTLGEVINEKEITIRTSLIGPELDPNGRGLLSWFLRQEGVVQGFSNSIWTGLTTIEFAKVILHLIEHKVSGLFQYVPNTQISKYSLLILFSKYFSGNQNIIKVENNKTDKSLIPIIADGFKVASYDVMIAEMADWINNHPTLYPNIYCKETNHE